MKKLLIFGAGDIGELAHWYFTHDAKRDIAAFTVDAAFVREDRFAGMPVVPFESVHDAFPPDSHDLFVAVSYAKLNTLRRDKYLEGKRRGYGIATYVSSHATVLNDGRIGENCFILEDNTIQPFAAIGNNVTLWSGNHIGHHSTIADHCFITSHVVVSGGVRIGERSFVGVNATIRDHVAIGAGCVIGAGSLILKDAPDDSVHSAAGTEMARVPASRLRHL
jgi:sugar O-acyltransferase (sialic acid O-acetyltransferase NeuD family)